MITPQKRVTSADQAAAALVEAIMDGSIAPGSPLRLQDLARQLDMSMMPVREALRRLESLGLVEIEPHRGAWVRPISLADLLDTYFVRMHLEAQAMREAATRFSAADEATAWQALHEHEAAREAGDVVSARLAHERFHFALYRASGSTWLVRSIEPAWRNAERYRVESTKHAEHAEKRKVEHRRMLAALTLHDADAAATALVEHLQTTVDVVAPDLAQAEGVDLPELSTPQSLLDFVIRTR